MTISPPAPLAVADPIDIDLPCAGCGYNLRTSRHDAVCNECGIPVVRSLGRDNALWGARPAWLRSLSCGVWMMIAAQVLLAASLGMSLVAPRWLERMFDDTRVVLCGLLALAVLHAAGAWLLTRREQRFVRPPRADTAVRLAARIGMLGPPASLVLFIWFFTQGAAGPRTPFAVTGAVMALVIPGVLATYWHLRGLARRVLSRRMSEYATIVAVGGAITLLVFFAWFTASLLDVDVDVRSDAMFLAILLLLTAMLLFYLWSLVVLVLFAVAFAKASRGARALWNERASP